MNKLWFRTQGIAYKGKEPEFFNPQDFEWAKNVIANYNVILKELHPLIENDEKNILKSYFETEVQSSINIWKTEGFYFWSRANRPLINMFPKTHNIIKDIPGLVTASINLLEPKSIIKEHSGDTNAIYRCHLGLKIPATLPYCGFRVKNMKKTWEEGNMLIFLDAYPHEAFNNSNDKRFILQLDVLRPEFYRRKHYICSRVLAITNYDRIMIINPQLKKYLLIFSSFLISTIQVYFLFYLFLQRTIFNTHLK